MEKREPVLSMRDLAVSFQASFGKIRAVRGVKMCIRDRMYRLYLLRVLEQLENWMKELTISAASFHRSWQ